MRPEGRIKMGYYPTPLSVAKRIRTFLGFPSDNVNILDPCCGEGTVLKNFVDGTNVTTYGIELDEYRAKQAKEVFDHVLHCGYEDARISNKAYGCLFLNPPYDWQSTNLLDEHGQERTENVFLKGTVRYLMPDGVLVYVVQQQRITGDVAKNLSYRFENFNTYRFQDGEYEQFKQIVLFGRKKRKNLLDNNSLGMLNAIPYTQLEEIPHLEEPIYELPASPQVKLFRSTLIDEAELEKELISSALWEKIGRNGNNGKNGLGRPPLPLHTGHLGLLLASGCLDGKVGEGEDRHIVRGKVEKIIHTEQEYQGDVLIEREVERYRVSIKVLTQDGEIKNLM